MTAVQPVVPVQVPVTTLAQPTVRASALAAFQLVEDARHRTPDRRRRDERRRMLAQRAVAERKAEREHRPDPSGTSAS
jgi:hypothetical protein